MVIAAAADVGAQRCRLCRLCGARPVEAGLENGGDGGVGDHVDQRDEGLYFVGTRGEPYLNISRYGMYTHNC